MMRRVLVTGHTGFTGRHLAAALKRRSIDVLGLSRSTGADLGDRAAVARLVEAAQPETVFHLAGANHYGPSDELYALTVQGTAHLLEAVANMREPARVVIASSSAVYGRLIGPRPFHERMPPRPVSHHGVAKLAEEQIALMYHRTRGLAAVIVRPFNLVGPGLSTALAPGAFVDAVVVAEESGGGAVRTGSLSAIRDFVDVRDAVEAYMLIAEHGRPGAVYNVCSGVGEPVGACIDILRRLSRVRFSVDVTPGSVAPGVDRQVGSYARLERATGWRPSIPLERSLADMLAWRRSEART